jgi:predicted DNA-binding transcriptional regulator AlpA
MSQTNHVPPSLGDDPIYSKAVFASYIRKSISTVDRMIARGDAPVATQLSPGGVGFRWSHIQAWLDSRAVPPGAGGLDAAGGFDAGGLSFSDDGAPIPAITK